MEDQDIGEHRGDDAENKTPVNVGAWNGTDHVDGADLARRGLVEARRITHRPLDQVVEHRERDIDQQQARNRFVDAAILAQGSGQHDPQTTADHARAGHRHLHHQRRRGLQRQRCAGGGQRADQKSAFAADDDHAELRRQRRAQRGQDQRRRAGQRILP